MESEQPVFGVWTWPGGQWRWPYSIAASLRLLTAIIDEREDQFIRHFTLEGIEIRSLVVDHEGHRLSFAINTQIHVGELGKGGHVCIRLEMFN